MATKTIRKGAKKMCGVCELGLRDDGLNLFFATGGEYGVNSFGWDRVGKVPNAAIGERNIGTAGVVAGNSLAAGWIHDRRHLRNMQIARFHPVDAAVGDFDKEDGVGEAIDDVGVTGIGVS